MPSAAKCDVTALLDPIRNLGKLGANSAAYVKEEKGVGHNQWLITKEKVPEV